MNLQKQILEHMSREMSADMDREILWGMLVEAGWHRIDLDRYTDNHHAIDIREWVLINCSGEYRSHGAAWLFEQQSDAVLFKLRWA